jgi:hypothetical protein
LPSDPRFMGSNLAESNGFLRAIKIHSMPYFGGEVQLPAPCCKILLYFVFIFLFFLC